MYVVLSFILHFLPSTLAALVWVALSSTIPLVATIAAFAAFGATTLVTGI